MDRDTFDYSTTHPSDWEWTFLLDEQIKFGTLNGNDDIQFITDVQNKILNGFIVKIYNKDLWHANWEAFEKARILTNLLSIVCGEFISAHPDSMKIRNIKGETKTAVMDVYNPLTPLQELNVDLSNQNIMRLLSDKGSAEILHHLANALHSSYKNPDSSIRELVLAYGDRDNLPKQYQIYYPLRNALSHVKITNIVKKQVQTQFPKSKFSKKNLDKTSALNRSNIIMANFQFLHSALTDFRRKFGLITRSRERTF